MLLDLSSIIPHLYSTELKIEFLCMPAHPQKNLRYWPISWCTSSTANLSSCSTGNNKRVYAIRLSGKCFANPFIIVPLYLLIFLFASLLIPWFLDAFSITRRLNFCGYRKQVTFNINISNLKDGRSWQSHKCINHTKCTNEINRKMINTMDLYNVFLKQKVIKINFLV